MKKLNKFLTAALLTVSFASLAACVVTPNDSSSSDSASTETQVKADLYLEKVKLNMMLGDEFQLKAVYNEIAGASLVYDSLEKTVATVSADGTVSAMGVGTATITASYGGETATCTVTVTTSDYEPTLRFEENLQSAVVVNRTENVNLNTYVSFNGKSFTDAAVQYTYSDETVGSVDENGYFKPAKTGKTTVTLKAVWRGMENALMEKSVEITVKSGTVATANGEQKVFTLYTVGSHGGQTYQTEMPFDVKVTEDDGTTPVSGLTVSVVEGADLLTYANGQITTKGKYGSAIVAAQGQDELHGSIYHEFRVDIVRPVAESSYVGNLCATDGSLDLDAMTKIFGKADTQVYSAESETTELTVEDGKILGFTQTENAVPQAQKLTVYNDEVGYEISVKVYAGVIRTPSDFSKLVCAPKTSTQSTKSNVNTLTGYYILGNDVDMADVTLESQGNNITGAAWYEFEKVGFRGIFDGQGYTIKNFKAPSYGMFGVIGQGAVIKNMGITNVTLSSWGKSTLAAYVVGATLENLYISGDITKSGTALIAGNVDTTSTIKNCIFEVKNFTTPTSGNEWGVIGWMYGVRKTGDPRLNAENWKDSYIIGNVPAVVDTRRWYTVDAVVVDGKTSQTEDSTEWLNLQGFKRYTSWEAFISDSAANEATVAAFDRTLWNLDCGVPVWGTENKLSVIKIGTQVAQDGMRLAVGSTGKITAVGVGVGEIPCTVTLVSGTSLTLSNNTYTAAALGESTLRVSYTYDGQTITKEVEITVAKHESSAKVSVNGKETTKVNLVPNGANTAAFAIKGAAGTLEVLSGQEILEIDGMNVKVVSGGKAVVRMKWTENGYDYNVDVDILSMPEKEDKTDLTLNFDTSKGAFTADELKEIFGESEQNTTILYAMLGDDELTVANGAISGVAVNSSMTTQKLTLVSKTRTVELNILAYTKIFREADDLFVTINGKDYSYFDMTDTSRFETITINNKTYPRNAGQYLLGADIDMSTDTRVMACRWDMFSGLSYYDGNGNRAGFVGLFNGGGHTITGMTVGKMGMFGFLGRADIRNLALKDVKFTQETNADYSYLFAQYICGNASAATKFTNVYVSVKQAQLPYSESAPATNSWLNSGILAYRSSQYAKYENFVVDFSQLGEINVIQRGIFAFGDKSELNTMTNAFVISKAPLVLGYGGTNQDGRYGKFVDAYNKKDVDWTGKKFAWIHGAHGITGEYAGRYGMITVDVTKSEWTDEGKTYRFESVAEMKEYIAANNVKLDGFDGKFWDTSTGVPVWKF